MVQKLKRYTVWIRKSSLIHFINCFILVTKFETTFINTAAFLINEMRLSFTLMFFVIVDEHISVRENIQLMRLLQKFTRTWWFIKRSIRKYGKIRNTFFLRY